LHISSFTITIPFAILDLLYPPKRIY